MIHGAWRGWSTKLDNCSCHEEKGETGNEHEGTGCETDEGEVDEGEEDDDGASEIREGNFSNEGIVSGLVFGWTRPGLLAAVGLLIDE